MITVYLKDGRKIKIPGDSIVSSADVLGIGSTRAGTQSLVVRSGDNAIAAFAVTDVAGWHREQGES